MAVGSYQFHRRAVVTLQQLAADEQAQVLDALAGLADTPVAQWPAAQAKRLPGEPPLYLVRVNDSLRAIIQAADGEEPKVMDIVRHETLEFFAKTAGNKENGT
jgi:hypothetical protein